ncbi:MAG: hypothetical protein WD607_04565 [Candidatus Paceibacterota bacterium]
MEISNLPYPRALLDEALTDNLLALQLFQEFENKDDNYITTIFAAMIADLFILLSLFYWLKPDLSGLIKFQ